MKRVVLFFIISIVITSCSEVSDDFNGLFDSRPATDFGIDFTNTLAGDSSFNIMQYLYYYNGGGVAAGDINNDGWVDLFFTGNEVDDALYVNIDGHKFTDISVSSGIAASSGWSTGVTMVDVNNDGWLDIYVCRLGAYKKYNDHNRLYINNGDLTFTEKAHEYGLDFSGFATQAIFIDYDNDGDQDCYILNHNVKRTDQFVSADKIRYQTDSLAGDKLMRNDGNTFTDVTSSSGIFSTPIGFGLGIAAADLNDDGWTDLYVGNDFHENDYIYINQGDGTFNEVINQSTGHTSNFTMGVTIDDVNLDGMLDIVSLDMQAEDEVIYKQSGGWENMEIYNFKRSYGYHHQLPRNALQIGCGFLDSIPIYKECAALHGIEATDWSWSPLIADFTLDGIQDIFITNGIYRRPNDMDFVSFFSDRTNIETSTDQAFIQKMPNGEVANVFFHGDVKNFKRYDDKNPKISNGACSADIDNDGDLDIITNNINENATVYINNANPKSFVKISLNKSKGQNTSSHGRISIRGKESKTLYGSKLLYGSSGFLSTNEQVAIFPYQGENLEVTVYWEGGEISLYDIEHPGIYKFEPLAGKKTTNRKSLLQPTTMQILPIKHVDIPFNDQSIEALIPYGQSGIGPKMDGAQNGHIYMTNGKGGNGAIFDRDGNLVQQFDKNFDTNYVDETDVTFFDADGDGDEDLYVCIGGNELRDGELSLIDILYINDGGKYVQDNRRLPKMPKNTSTVVASDYDLDGDVDLFVGVQSKVGAYGMSDASYLLRNEANDRFKALRLEGLTEMVYDAQWSDMDLDGRQDLVVVGHWMPVTIMYNREGGFQKYVIPNSEGWWNTVEVSDVNGDGLMDIIGGNFGNNHRLEVDATHPINLYINDFDKNGKIDPIMSYWHGGNEYPYANLDMLLRQLPIKKKDNLSHQKYAKKVVTDIFTKAEIATATKKKISTLSSTLFLQNPLNEWKISPFDQSLQCAPIYEIEPYKSGYLIGGNQYNVDPNLGRQDAMSLTYMHFKDGAFQEEYIGLPFINKEIRSIHHSTEGIFIGLNSENLYFIK